MTQIDITSKNGSLSNTQKMLDVLENNYVSQIFFNNNQEIITKKVKTKFAQDIELRENVDLTLSQNLLERIQTELYKIDQSPDYQNPGKQHKNALVPRKIIDYLLYQESDK